MGCVFNYITLFLSVIWNFALSLIPSQPSRSGVSPFFKLFPQISNGKILHVYPLFWAAPLLVDLEIKDSVTDFDILMVANTSFPLIIAYALTMCAKTKNPNFSLFSLAHWADRFPSLEWRSGLVVRSSTNCFASEVYFSIVLGQWHSFYEDRWENHTLKHMHTTMI